MRLKDPTAWMDDLTVYVDDEEIAATAALLEPDLLYRAAPNRPPPPGWRWSASQADPLPR